MEKGLNSYEVFDDCLPCHRRIVPFICVVTFREITRIQYLLYRVSLLSVFSFSSVWKTQLYFVIAQQLTKQIYQRPLEAAITANNKLIHPRIVTSFANICHSQEKRPLDPICIDLWMDSIFNYKHSCQNNNSVYLMSVSCGLILLKLIFALLCKC